MIHWRQLAFTGALLLSATAAQAASPSDYFDLSHWYLTLPDANATVVSTQQLTAGYSSNYFYAASWDGSMRFWAPVTGGTTSGTTYPRSELREMIDPNDMSVNWYAEGTHVLTAACRVLQAPSSMKIIIGQIHAFQSRPLVKLQWNNGKVRVQFKDYVTGSNDETVKTFTQAPGYGLIHYRIKEHDGVIYVTMNGETVSHNFLATDPNWANVGFYFKAGAYVQDHDGPSTEGGLVRFTRLDITHSN